MVRIFSSARACAIVAICLSLAAGEIAFGQGDGKRAVDVPRYGVHVRVPQAWDLVDWSRDDTAFVCDLPQDRNSPVGHASCKITVAPENLEVYQRQFAAEGKQSADKAATKTQPRRALLRNELSSLAKAKFLPELVEKFERRLTAEWEFENIDGVRWFERRELVIGDGMLYTFTLDSDESHYDAYVPDFEEMLAAAQIKPLDVGLKRIEEDYWLQSEYHFAIKLPPTWRPAFAPNGRMLFYAVGAAHGLFSDNLVVLASPSKGLELEQLVKEMPAEVKRLDEKAKVACSLVPQGKVTALETVIHTKRGLTDVVILERRFQTKTRNYELKITCESETFRKQEAELRAALDGFVELPPAVKPSET